ncbi:alpha/beta fold hydrolase [Cellulosimicrobium cellulans]|uniref:Alpha/beta hydrolase n=1 Tax=Cellulosimicrobium funkei TaxID=264251 RepID=A0A4Y8R693_9MICO|nr:alpha/beta hydrolase [Cellulosimicrobium funkei]TFF17007.1 alpha/beta hydrolase [Cellulosimicrobium funkei]TGA70865.1 alpha/beta hydrolase [Cellulosimicrobium terreum]
MSETTTRTTSRTLDVPGAVLAYDVRTPAAPGDLPPLVVMGSPMAASGFGQLVDLIDDRVVVTYDPRGTERSTLAADGEVSVERHADDLHEVVAALGLGPVDVFGSSGGGVVGLSWIERHPEDVRTFVAHEPPITPLLEDAETATAVQADIVETYRREGFGPAMAKFVALVSHVGPLPADYLDRPAPDPAMFGFPTEDDGSRDDLLLGLNLATMPSWAPDGDALRAATTRIVPAVSAAGEGTLAWRGGAALAALLGVEPVTFPGDHGGFMVNEWSPANDPAAFAATLREALAG